MADPVQYTGATYNAEMYKKPNETITEYMTRLSRLRSKGILGGGGMLDFADPPTTTTPDFASPEADLAVLKRNVNQSSDSDSTPIRDMRTPEQKLRDAVAHQSGAESNVMGMLTGALGLPFMGAIADAQERSLIRADLEKRYSPEQAEQIMDNPKALAEYYATGAITNDPLDINVEDAGTSIGYMLSNPIDALGSAFGFNMYDDVTAPKVYGLGDWNTAAQFASQPAVFSSTFASPMQKAQVGGMLLDGAGIADTNTGMLNNIIKRATDPTTGMDYTITNDSESGMVRTNADGSKGYMGGGNQGWTSPSNDYSATPSSSIDFSNDTYSVGSMWD